MPTRILLLMSTRTYRAEAFLMAAAQLGLDVTVATEQEHVLSVPGSTIALDFRHPERAERQAVAFARSYPIQAVVGVDDDTTILAAHAAQALGLPHNSVESVQAARYKDVMRVALSETDLPAPAFELVGLDEDPLLAARRVAYPCVLKPLSLSGSRGVIRADDEVQFAAAFREIAAILAESDLAPDDPGRRQILVEDFIPGRELALEGLLVGGRLTTLALFDKPDPLDGPYFEETIYVTPSRAPHAVQSAIEAAVGQAAATLGLREGPIHAEVRVNERGVWVVEVAPRSIGGLCSRALRFDVDLSLEEIILRHAAGLGLPSTERERRAAGVMMIPIPAEGTLYDVQGLDAARAVPGVEEVTISIARGQAVVALPRAARYLGFIFARGQTPAAVESVLREAHGHLEFDIRAGLAPVGQAAADAETCLL